MNSSCFYRSNTYLSSGKTATLSASPITIRLAKLEDVNSLADILTHSFHPPQGYFSWVQPLLKLGICEDLRTRIFANSPHYSCLVASKLSTTTTLEEEQILGTVEISLYSHCWSNSGFKSPYIANLAVNSLARRQGVAKKLLQKCEFIALEWGFEQLTLHVLENNYQAKQLYLRSGYQIERIESSFNSWFWGQPRRLFLKKKLVN